MPLAFQPRGLLILLNYMQNPAAGMEWNEVSKILGRNNCFETAFLTGRERASSTCREEIQVNKIQIESLTKQKLW